MKISEQVNRLSLSGCESILRDLPHVSMGTFYCYGQDEEETLEDMKKVIQCNLDSGKLDEIEVLIVLSGE